MPDVDSFIARFRASGGGERSNAQLFLTELCDVLGVPRPEPAGPDTAQNAYVFERPIVFHHADGSTKPGYADLYKRGCFVLETKQGVEAEEAAQALSEAGAARRKTRRHGHGTRGTGAWDTALIKAHAQAQGYARALPAEEGRPPFVVVVDVGHCIELYSEFTRTGGAYVPFPDPRTHRIYMDDLAREEIRERLRLLWTDPLALDPSRRSAQVTREIADRLAKLAKSLEAANHRPETVAGFLMRCLFTMFAEDVQLLPKDKFTGLLRQMRHTPENFQPAIEDLWRVMNTGGFHSGFMEKLLRFNGGLFADPTALPLNRDQLELLIEAAERQWRDVEPAIFGTLLERALDPQERHKLGAHYTPRAYVERLILPTLVEPLREEWAGVQAAVSLQLAEAEALHEEAAAIRHAARSGDTAAKTSDKAHKLEKKAADEEKGAVKTLEAFLKRLCETRILDPACGSGNFLYVALEHLKRIESEVLTLLQELDPGKAALLESEGITVDPHQLLGIEINPRAATIAELVLWIGYLQWHYRTHGGVQPPEPIIKNFKNIENRDAVLDYDQKEIVVDPNTLQPLTRWNGRSMKKHPVTGEDVPDEAARTLVYRYTNPRPALWPKAEFVVGNPPFIGTSRMRDALGDGYTETIRKTIKTVPESSDFVMYWWDQAAELCRAGEVRRFGFITTNSLRQTFNRRVVERHLSDKKPLSILFAIPDHPWVDAADGAAVRISMTVGVAGEREGVLKESMDESRSEGDHAMVVFRDTPGKIFADLKVGAEVNGAAGLVANAGVSSRGVQVIGAGFIVNQEEAVQLGLGRIRGIEQHIRDYRNGRDLTDKPRGVMVIDLYGLDADEVRTRYPEIYQWVHDRVKPERDANNRKSYRERWWIHGEPRGNFRPALRGLPRYIATVETSKHRFFVFLDANILPDNMLVNIAVDDAYALGVLSSNLHVTWALAAGGRLGVGNDPRYNKTRCFETFPFPAATEAQRAQIRELGERLDAHRKARQAEHPELTMTGMYNVLEKLRSGEALTKKEQAIHAQGLVSVLKEIHDALDAAVCAAYGWPVDLSEEDILSRLVALNAERAAEEAAGHVRWLRPEYQNPAGRSETQLVSPTEAQPVAAKAAAIEQRPWPKDLPARAQAVRAALAALAAPADAATVAKCFKGAQTKTVGTILETLATLGQCRTIGGAYVV